MNKPADKNAIMKQAQGAAPSSEATQIEQSRAVAQVQGALVVAQQRPRNVMDAMTRIREACGSQRLADRAFFRYSRGGGQITGPSIHLATELARCWGNVEFGIVELRRDDRKSESEMLAVAWDLETNARVTNSFIVPHRRDTKHGQKELTDLRDIYENNANAGARRLRECIFRIIPVHVREEAIDLCNATLEHGGGEPLPKRIEKMMAAFAGFNVTAAQIERRLGIAVAKMKPVDLANLGVVYQSIKRGEVRVEDEFPSDRAKAITDDLKGQEPTPGRPSNEAAETIMSPETAPASKQPAETPDNSTASEDVDSNADDWAAVAQEMIERIGEAGSLKALDAALASPRFRDLDRMATAAAQQWRAVTGFIEERRKELGG